MSITDTELSMKVNATFLFLSACAATVFGSEQVLKSTHTVTKTHTKTVATHTLVPTPSGWLPAKSTKNDHPDAQAAAQPAAVKQPKALKKPVTEIPGSEADTGSTNSSSKPSVTTVTKWASTTATVTTTYSSYAACKSTSNYVHNGAADGTSGVDGVSWLISSQFCDRTQFQEYWLIHLELRLRSIRDNLRSCSKKCHSMLPHLLGGSDLHWKCLYCQQSIRSGMPLLHRTPVWKYPNLQL